MGGLDALVYSAGISRFTELEHATLEEWQAVFQTNVFGAAVVTAAAVPHLREAKGHAIYLSSESALYQPDSWRGNGIYIASKIAMESMVRSFHTEVPEVAFTNYIVGATMTEFDGGDMEKMQGFVEGWFAKGYIRPVILMPETHGEAVVNILTSPGYMDVVSVRAR
jgi:NAD(P)-dependent dehydrogenase (short-subunit alcohol dehydrogenase family)